VSRWAIFNAVGVIGFVVQLAVLTVLLHAGAHYLVATVLAVEAAVLHNFLWHERWTWRDRTEPPPEADLNDTALAPLGSDSGRGRRLVGFHLLNGAISLVGNLLVMQALAGGAGLPPVAANTLSVGICALVNFVASDRLVFPRRNSALLQAPLTIFQRPHPYREPWRP
jgi:putative flippase GtrA